jgi:DnaK suppressor protein
MTPDLQFVQQILNQKLSGITVPQAWRDSIAIRSNADLADTTQQAIQRELVCRDLDRNASLARDLRAALGRVADGSYGCCLECDEKISPKRLAAMPWAALCLSCQEEAESAGSQDERLAA